MLIDGKQIAAEIGDEIRTVLEGKAPLSLLVLQVGNDAATESFVRMKKRFAESVGIGMEVESFEEKSTTADLITRIQKANADKKVHGIIVQLPLPASIDTSKVLDAISVAKDPDVLSGEARARFAEGSGVVMPPVVAAIVDLLERFRVDLNFANIAVLGYGRLVGEPVGTWLRSQNYDYAQLTEEDEDPTAILVESDVIICGVGKPGLVCPEMVKEECVIIDAGTSEQGGVLKGDADPRCAEKASLMTPVPGGVGPIAVAMLFANLVALSGETAK